MADPEIAGPGASRDEKADTADTAGVAGRDDDARDGTVRDGTVRDGMADDELVRVRRALSGIEPEIDLARLYTESRVRALDAASEEPRGRGRAEGVEILLRDPASGARRLRSTARRGPALAWGAAAAAAAILVVSLAGPPVLRALPGSLPGAGTSSTADPSPTLGLTPREVIARAAQAMGSDSCGLKTRSTLGSEQAFTFDEAGPAGAAPPKAVPLDPEPLRALQEASVGVVLDLSGIDGRDYLLEDLGVEELDGQSVVRIRITPSDAMVPDGVVLRIDLLVDVATWLPLAGETWAVSDRDTQYVVQNEFSWSGCGEPSPGPTAHDDTPGS